MLFASPPPVRRLSYRVQTDVAGQSAALPIPIAENRDLVCLGQELAGLGYLPKHAAPLAQQIGRQTGGLGVGT